MCAQSFASNFALTSGVMVKQAENPVHTILCAISPMALFPYSSAGQRLLIRRYSDAFNTDWNGMQNAV